MRKKIAVALIVGLISASTLPLAFASKARKRKPDVYPATEEGPSEEVISSAPGYRGNAEEALPPPQAIRVSAAATAPAPSVSAPTTAATYDPVPSSQAEPLIRRLRLVEELVSKYGRAYDYRTLTVTDLQNVLARLNAQAAQAAEIRQRMNTQAEIRKTVESDIGSEAPEAPTPFEAGSTGPDAVAPIQAP